mgnify:CR=1 FL=1
MAAAARRPTLVAISVTVGLSFLATGILVVEPGQAGSPPPSAAAGVLWPLAGARVGGCRAAPPARHPGRPAARLLTAWGFLHYPTWWATRGASGRSACSPPRRWRCGRGHRGAGGHGLPPGNDLAPAWPNPTLYDIARIAYP